MRTSGSQLIAGIRAALASGDRASAAAIVTRSYASWGGRRVCGETLSCAAQEGAIEIVDLMLASGVPVDLTNSHGFSALEVVAQRGLNESALALLARGADPSRSDRKRGVSSAFALAAFRGDEELVASMIERGADLRDVTQLEEVALLRIPGRVLRRVRSAGGEFCNAIEQLLDGHEALGDEAENG